MADGDIRLMDLQTQVGELKRVGPKTAELLRSKGLLTAGDLVAYYPSRYEKYMGLSAVSQTEENNTFFCRVSFISKPPPKSEAKLKRLLTKTKLRNQP